MKKISIRILLSFIGVYILLLCVMFFAQRSLMYFPQSRVSAEVASEILPNAQIVDVVTADNLNLKAYFSPPKDAGRPIILLFHGNGSLGLYQAPNFKKVMEMGYGLLLAEYRGYGGNPGSPSEEGLYHDASAYLAYLKAQYPNTSIIAYGRSLGSGVVVDLAAKNPDAFTAMILEAPFDSALNVSDMHYPFVVFKKWLLRDQYLSNEKIGKITIPKLFLLAGQDEVVGLESGLRLYEVAAAPKLVKIYPEAAHTDVSKYGAENDLIVFLQDLSK